MKNPVSRQLKRKQVKAEDRWKSVQIENRWRRKSEMGFYGDIQAEDKDLIRSSNTQMTLNDSDMGHDLNNDVNSFTVLSNIS